ncbi:hypothetical protein HMPREF9141_0970 [Prevotella multiformis DSM 16608]|uniref:Uncharacterized protein n=1 Tax=Prevotella multiformis DSM 16608 TaxID=888743 RepID=F0F5V4_9BACT|nr:hypothetical protein HMPREF9141_0970 [Prevotella multiformis DSM 16608]
METDIEGNGYSVRYFLRLIRCCLSRFLLPGLSDNAGWKAKEGINRPAL